MNTGEVFVFLENTELRVIKCKELNVIVQKINSPANFTLPVSSTVWKTSNVLPNPVLGLRQKRATATLVITEQFIKYSGLFQGPWKAGGRLCSSDRESKL